MAAASEPLRRRGCSSHHARSLHSMLYAPQMLLAVQTVHEERIVHSDLKPANFLLVEGTLKLIDFGIASAIQNDATSVVRENQVRQVYASDEEHTTSW